MNQLPGGAAGSVSSPTNWEVTTAPPVANAAKTLMIRLFSMSTRDAGHRRLSDRDIITVSAIPTVMASACSKSRGIISFFRSKFENNLAFSVTFLLTA